MELADIVKNSNSSTEPFNADKLLQSILSACLSVHCPEGEAESTASRVTESVKKWAGTKPAVTSHDIRRVAGLHLERFHPEAAYMYMNQRSII